MILPFFSGLSRARAGWVTVLPDSAGAVLVVPAMTLRCRLAGRQRSTCRTRDVHGAQDLGCAVAEGGAALGVPGDGEVRTLPGAAAARRRVLVPQA
jgi:hypothetical protein